MGKLPQRKYRDLHLGEWLKATGRDQKRCAEAAGVDASYISSLIDGRKRNPSAAVMLDISEYLGITVNDLYRKPPPLSAIESLAGLSPTARNTLSRRK